MEENKYVFNCLSDFTKDGLRTTCNVNPALLEALGLGKQPVQQAEEEVKSEEEQEK